MSTIFTDIEGILSGVVFITSLEDNEIRLSGTATALSAADAVTLHTSYDLPLAHCTSLAYTFSAYKMLSKFGSSSANALGNVLGSDLSPEHMLRADAAQLAEMTDSVLDARREFHATADALSASSVDLDATMSLKYEAISLPYAEANVTHGFPLTSNAKALSSVDDTALDTYKYVTSTASALSFFTRAIISVEGRLTSTANELASTAGSYLGKQVSLDSEAKCLGVAFGHFGYGEFISATTATQLSSLFGNITEAFALKCSANALSESSSLKLTVFIPLPVLASQLSSVSVFLDIEPFMHATAKCLPSSSASGITAITRLSANAEGLQYTEGLLASSAAMRSTQSTQLAYTFSKATIQLTIDGYLNELTYVFARIKPRHPLKSEAAQLAKAVVTQIAFQSKLLSEAISLTFIETASLLLYRPLTSNPTSEPNTYSFATEIDFMHDSQAAQLSDAISKITSFVNLGSEGIAIADAVSDITVSSKLISDAAQLATSAPVLTERIRFSADIVEIATVAGTSIKPTKRLPAAEVTQLAYAFADIQNNWTGLVARTTTQLSESSVVKIATRGILRSTGTALATVFGTRLIPNVTLDTTLSQLASLAGDMGAHRDFTTEIVQLSYVSSLVDLFKTLSSDLTALSDAQSALSISSKRMVSEIVQLADSTAGATCIKKLSSEATSLGAVFGHLYHDVILVADVTQLAFVSAKLQSQMKASATQLSVTQGRIRGSTFGRIYRPTLELYTG